MNFGHFSFRPLWMSQHPGVCGRCGIIHGWNRCPATATSCFKCGKVGHFARMCYTRISRRSVPIATVSSVTTATTQTVTSKSSRKVKRDSNRKKDFDNRRWMMSQLPFHRASDDTFKVELLERFCIARLEKAADEQDVRINFYVTMYNEMDKEITTLKSNLREKIKTISSLKKEICELKTHGQKVASTSTRKDPDLKLCRDRRAMKCTRGRGVNSNVGSVHASKELGSGASGDSSDTIWYSFDGKVKPTSNSNRGRGLPPNTGRVWLEDEAPMTVS